MSAADPDGTVERMARAMYEEADGWTSWPPSDRFTREQYRRLARAALAAARPPQEPTKEQRDESGPGPREVLAKLAAANPGTCRCGHTSSVHGFGSGECWTCAFDNDRPDCDRFAAHLDHTDTGGTPR